MGKRKGSSKKRRKKVVYKSDTITPENGEDKRNNNYKPLGTQDPRKSKHLCGWYKGFWCDSSYELAYVIYNLDMGIGFQRNTKKFPYKHNGKNGYWIPDFVLDNGTYVEVKGRVTEKVKAKFRDFTEPLIVLTKKNLKEVFRYVIKQYGENFANLYEGYRVISKPNSNTKNKKRKSKKKKKDKKEGDKDNKKKRR